PSQASQCELLNSSDEVQTGFGAAYNTLSTAKETLITADCAVNSANITIGSGQTTQYVYKYGYFWKNNQWEQIEFIPTGAVFDVWFVGKANINIPLSSEELAQDNFLVVYICSWTGTTWKCGCRDAYCATNYWQLQKFKYENNNIDLKEHGEMCFNENDCANNLFCVESARYGIEEQYCCYDGECAAVIPTQGDIPTGVFNCVGEGGIDEKDTLNGVEYYVCQGGDWLLNVCQDSDNDGYDNCNIGDTGDDGKTIDCDDSEYWVNPNGRETCDTVDNNCNGTIDEDCDNDNDGYCNQEMTMYRNNTMCPNTPFISNGQTGDDCDDSSKAINPGAAEICDGFDNNCNNQIDEGCVCLNNQTQPCGSDIGECQKGIQTCVNGDWGECVGEITPQTEICNDTKDNDCDSKTDCDDPDCSGYPDCAPADAISPQITVFNISPTTLNTNEQITINYTATDNEALSKIELWQTTDLNGLPNDSNWTMITSKTISGTSASGNFTDSIAIAGIYW
ncbi:MAG: putative metal-binding motif-containing protein, partial [Chloroflexota bacterium]|nr:putative metal-binding motif-containing protein [Chloroflexota bacterium]